jgi:glycosyltransferase involved in cell wall biosynthesis
MTAKVALAVPCFNERGRLHIARFAEGADKNNLRILFVDDGSTDGTADFIAEKIKNHPRLGLLRRERNRGKGAAVRAGVLQLAKECPDAEWIGFWDADLSTPLDEVRHMLGVHEMEGVEVDAIWASRVMRAGSHIDRRFNRHLFGRLFATAAGELLGVRAYDTQCGAKLFRCEIVPAAFGGEYVSRWIFDVELYQRIGPDRILECPVLAWTDQPGSKISVFREFPQVVRDLLRIRAKKGQATTESSRWP